MKKDSDDLRKELEKEAPFLAGLKEKPDGFTVPEGYFNQLQQAVLSKVAAERNPAPRKVVWLWPRFAAAASVVAATGLAIFLFLPDKPATDLDSTALSAEEVHQYITQNIDDFELDLIIRFAAADETTGGLFEGADLDDPQIQQYMEELLDDIDLETLEKLL